MYDGRKRLVWPQDKPLWDLYDEIKGIKNSTAVDVPFINLIPKEIQNNEWFDTVQKIITTRDFDNFSAYDDNVNWRDPGSSDGFCSQG